LHNQTGNPIHYSVYSALVSTHNSYRAEASRLLERIFIQRWGLFGPCRPPRHAQTYSRLDHIRSLVTGKSWNSLRAQISKLCVTS